MSKLNDKINAEIQERDAKIIAWRAEGKKGSWIREQIGVTRQRLYQIEMRIKAQNPVDEVIRVTREKWSNK